MMPAVRRKPVGGGTAIDFGELTVIMCMTNGPPELLQEVRAADVES